jgi:hypothetical protein
MGGGSKYEGPSSKTAEEAEQIIRSAVEGTGEEKADTILRNVFISFNVEDKAQVDLLRSQAKDERFGLEFRDYSVKEPFDEKWKTNCRDRIAQTSATICMMGPDTATRPAVIWELEESYRQGKLVIGVRIYRDRNYPIPKPLLDNRAPIINWDIDELNRLLSQ